MASTRELRIEARKLGIPDVRNLTTDELNEEIARAKSSKNGNKKAGTVTKAKGKVGRPRKAAVAETPVKRGPGRPRKVQVEETAAEPKRRGRPPGSKNKASASAATPVKRGRPRKVQVEETVPVKRGRGRPKRSGSAATKPVKRGNGKLGRPKGSGTGTRILVPERINFNGDYNFREGTQAQFILSQLRKSAKKYKDTADVREDTYETLEPQVNKIPELTFQDRSTGRAHKKERALAMLRYRVARTVLDYCQALGLHEGSGNGNGASVSPPKKRGRPKGSVTAPATPKRRGRPPKAAQEEEPVKRGRGRPRKSAVVETPKRRGRPPGTKNKAAAAAPTGKRRGRPPGSKNKARV